MNGKHLNQLWELGVHHLFNFVYCRTNHRSYIQIADDFLLSTSNNPSTRCAAFVGSEWLAIMNLVEIISRGSTAFTIISIINQLGNYLRLLERWPRNEIIQKILSVRRTDQVFKLRLTTSNDNNSHEYIFTEACECRIFHPIPMRYSHSMKSNELSRKMWFHTKYHFILILNNFLMGLITYNAMHIDGKSLTIPFDLNKLFTKKNFALLISCAWSKSNDCKKKK